MNPIYTHLSISTPSGKTPQNTASASRQKGVGKPLLITVVAIVAASAAWWAWSARHSGNGMGASGEPAHAASAAASGARGGSRGGGAGGGRFGAVNRVQPISVAAVRKQDVRVSVSAIGNITAANTAVVRAKVSGELKAFYFKEGQTVKAGALLAEIDPRPYQIALAQAQGTLVRDQAQLANAKIDLARYKDLLAKDAAPKQQMDTQQALVAQLEGTAMSDQAQVDNAKLQLSYTRVVAPISGLVGLKQVDIGNNVQPSDANGLLSIAQTRPVNVVFSVPDVQLPQILRQLKADKGLPVQAWDRDQTTKLADGKLASTDNAIDTATGTIKLKAQFANAKDELFPNQFVNVRLQVDNIEDTLAVPSAALLRGAQGTYVYLVNADSTVTVRTVTAGANDGDWISVQGQLKVGDKVVTDGADRLREGAQVEVIAPNAGGKGGAQGGGKRHGASAPASAPASALAPASTPAATANANPATTAEDPPWMSRMPPEVAAKIRAMSPDERAAWMQKRREERAKAAGNN
ncbi:MAG: MdtA/MuxA family multidrug efflux RND transporter periplasmic adaptor subunit [Rhodoferax sp.]